MNELYAETHLVRKTTPATIAMKLLLVIGVIVILFFAAYLGTLVLMIGVAAAFIVVWYWPRFNVEWEYVFCDGQMDFDMIQGGAKRKTQLRVDFEQMEVVARQDSHALDAYRQYKVKNFTSLQKDIVPYVMVVKVQNDLNQLLFEPSEKMLETMKNKSPRKVFITAEDKKEEA